MSTLPIDTQTDADEINWFDVLDVIKKNLRLLMLGPLLVGLITLGITFLIRPTFTAVTVFLPPQQQQTAASMLLQNLGVLGGAAGALTGLKNPNDQYVSFLKSQTIQEKLIQRFNLKERYDEKFVVDARKSLAKKTNMSSGKDGLITVQVDDHVPAFAAELANGYVEELRGVLQRLAITEAQQRRVFFEEQLLVTKEKLTKADQALGVSGVNSSVLKNNPATAIAAVASVQAQISMLEIKLSSMRNYLAESAPLYQQSVAELQALRAQMNKFERTNSTPSATDSDYIARYRDFKYYESLFELFARQFELAKVDEAREGVAIQVLDFASAPEKKSKPMKALISAAATVATGVLLLVFIFLRRHFRKLKMQNLGISA
jgi:tyrosine-protein kinase Etk/Wzc